MLKCDLLPVFRTFTSHHLGISPLWHPYLHKPQKDWSFSSLLDPMLRKQLVFGFSYLLLGSLVWWYLVVSRDWQDLAFQWLIGNSLVVFLLSRMMNGWLNLKNTSNPLNTNGNSIVSKFTYFRSLTVYISLHNLGLHTWRRSKMIVCFKTLSWIQPLLHGMIYNCWTICVCNFMNIIQFYSCGYLGTGAFNPFFVIAE